MLNHGWNVERLITDAVSVSAAVQQSDEAKRGCSDGESHPPAGRVPDHSWMISIQQPSTRRSGFPAITAAGTKPFAVFTRNKNGPGLAGAGMCTSRGEPGARSRRAPQVVVANVTLLGIAPLWTRSVTPRPEWSEATVMNAVDSPCTQNPLCSGETSSS